MRKTIRLFVLFEGIAFIVASLIHFGVLMHGYEHLWAGRAEGVIGTVLLIGYLLTWILPAWTRAIGIAVQALRYSVHVLEFILSPLASARARSRIYRSTSPL